MVDFINNPQGARQYYEEMPKNVRYTFKSFSTSDFVRFAQVAYGVLLQNRAYLSHKKQLSLTKAQLSQNQSVIAKNAKWILRGLDLCDYKKGWIYQGEYTPSLKNLKIRIEKMAQTYGFSLCLKTDQEIQKPLRLFQVFRLENVKGENLSESRRLDWASRQTLNAFVRENRSFIRSM